MSTLNPDIRPCASSQELTPCHLRLNRDFQQWPRRFDDGLELDVLDRMGVGKAPCLRHVVSVLLEFPTPNPASHCEKTFLLHRAYPVAHKTRSRT